MKVKCWKSTSAFFDTHKFRVQFDDGEVAEIVRVDRGNKMIYCVSCMVGCPAACPMCASGLRYVRPLKAREMMELFDAAHEPTDLPILVSMMGSGEPLLNATEVRRFLGEVKADKYAISTSGLGIHRLPVFLDIPKLKLQVSVHAVEDKLRRRIVPGTLSLSVIVYEVLSIWPLEQIEWNFVFWDGLNDSESTSSKIAIWARRYGIHKIKVNAARGDLILSSRRTHNIIRELKAFGLDVEFYETDGEDIQAGCGQLV